MFPGQENRNSWGGGWGSVEESLSSKGKLVNSYEIIFRRHSYVDVISLNV